MDAKGNEGIARRRRAGENFAMKQNWTKPEETLLIKLYRNRMTLFDIRRSMVKAGYPARSLNAIWHKVEELFVHTRDRPLKAEVAAAASPPKSARQNLDRR